MKRYTKKAILTHIALSVVFTAGVVGGLCYIARTTEENTRIAGRQIAENYQLQDSALFMEHQMILRAAKSQVNYMMEEGSSPEEVQAWLQRFSDDLKEDEDTTFITGVFAAIDGVYYPYSGWIPPDTYQLNEREWYRQSLENDGAFTCSDVYVDAERNVNVVTLSMGIGDGNTVGIDILQEQFNHLPLLDYLESGHLQVFYDRKGTVVGHMCGSSDCNHDAAYFNSLYQLVQEKKGDFDYTDADGKRQSVFLRDTKTGWLSVTQLQSNWSDRIIPYILFGLALCTAFYLFMFVRILWHNHQVARQAQRSQRMVRALSNIYHEVYLVRIDLNQVEAIKPSQEVEQAFGLSGSYTELLKVFGKLVKGDGNVSFAEQFSLKQLKTQMKAGVTDYGGDFLRYIGGEAQWVGVRLLFDVEELSRNEVLLIFEQINYRKQRELLQRQLLEESIQEAQTASRAKSEFLSNMSHEMRTPLNGILGFAELADRHSNDSKELYTYIKKIQQSSRLLLELINNLLDMVKVEQGDMELHPEELDVVEQVKACADIFLPQVEKAGKTLTLSVDVKNPVVLGDEMRLTQIFNNLLSNAVKFTEKGDTITVKLWEEELYQKDRAMYHLVVEDTGIGMSNAFLERIFKPFEQEQSSLQKKVSGTGLGMPIVQSLVQAMQGTITVDSELGKGSTFRVSIPMKPVKKCLWEGEVSGEETETLDGVRILLVEDNEINMEITRELLTMLGMEVEEAWNGREAVEKFAASPIHYYHVILMDMKMPEMDGCEATRRIRAMEREDAKTVPIFAVTANAFDDDITMAHEAGMNAHLAKPVDFDHLLSLLREHRT